MERFLRYSLEHGRPIRLIFLRAGRIQQRNVEVTALEAGRVALRSKRPREAWEMPLQDILGADYARGDEGQD